MEENSYLPIDAPNRKAAILVVALCGVEPRSRSILIDRKFHEGMKGYVERLEIGMGFVRGFSVCVGESEEEMSELFFAWFLVVSELRGDGGHVSSRIQVTPVLSLLPQTVTSPR